MRTSRRSTLGLAFGGVITLGAGLSGCDLGASSDTGPRTETPPAASADQIDGRDDPDQAVVVAALAALDLRVAALGAARDAYPRLRRPLSALAAMHLAHRGVLEPAPPSRATPASPPGAGVGPTPTGALRRIRTAEMAYQRSLVDAALAARSGPLARLLASMSASVGQQLAVLPIDLGRPG